MTGSSIESFRATEAVIYLANGMAVAREGLSVPSADLPRRMLAVMLLRPGEIVPTEQLKKELWGVNLPKSHAKTFHSYTNDIRKCGFRLKSFPQGYQLLDITLDQVDVLRFLAMAKRLHDHPTPCVEQRLLDWEWVLGTLRGEVFADFHGQGQAAQQWSRHVDAVRKGVVHQLRQLRLQLGRHAQIVEELMVAWQDEPTREDLAGLLMVALYRCMRRADAFRVYQQTCDALEEEFGCDPVERLRLIHRRINQDDPSLLNYALPVPGLSALTD